MEKVVAIQIKTPKQIETMRIAGRLAAEVLDHITPHVLPGVTTGELDEICHHYMVNVQKTIPAPLNYAPPGYSPFPKSICTSVNHQICHGIPGAKKLKNGDIVNVDVTVIYDGYHGDTSRMYYVGGILSGLPSPVPFSAGSGSWNFLPSWTTGSSRFQTLRQMSMISRVRWIGAS